LFMLEYYREYRTFFIEHINAKIKTFQILKQKYRNRCKEYNLRTNLICGMINFDRKMGL